MANRPRLRSTDDLVVPALAQTVTALNPPESDAALVRLAEVTAAAIDAMPIEMKAAMLGQTAPLLLKLLQELDVRAQKRSRGRQPGRPNRLDQLRAAHASGRRPDFL